MYQKSFILCEFKTSCHCFFGLDCIFFSKNCISAACLDNKHRAALDSMWGVLRAIVSEAGSTPGNQDRVVRTEEIPPIVPVDPVTAVRLTPHTWTISCLGPLPKRPIVPRAIPLAKLVVQQSTRLVSQSPLSNGQSCNRPEEQELGKLWSICLISFLYYLRWMLSGLKKDKHA